MTTNLIKMSRSTVLVPPGTVVYKHRNGPGGTKEYFKTRMQMIYEYRDGDAVFPFSLIIEGKRYYAPNYAVRDEVFYEVQPDCCFFQDTLNEVSRAAIPPYTGANPLDNPYQTNLYKVLRMVKVPPGTVVHKHDWPVGDKEYFKTAEQAVYEYLDADALLPISLIIEGKRYYAPNYAASDGVLKEVPTDMTESVRPLPGRAPQTQFHRRLRLYAAIAVGLLLISCLFA